MVHFAGRELIKKREIVVVFKLVKNMIKGQKYILLKSRLCEFSAYAAV